MKSTSMIVSFYRVASDYCGPQPYEHYMQDFKINTRLCLSVEIVGLYNSIFVPTVYE